MAVEKKKVKKVKAEGKEKKVKKSKDKKSKKTSTSKLELISENLHTRWRPHTLDDFVGQESQVKIIRGWFKIGRIPSTIMIKGLTGSGKTTLAHIIAQYANCDTLSACGKCDSCKLMKDMEYSHPDLVELNTGEVGGKESILNVIQAANNRPMFRKKIILLDESHLMSKAAESSLLVPTEKPPKDTIWIFCTTDPEKMNKTLVNRSARIDIRPIDPDLMAKRLLYILEEEGLSFKKKEKEEAAKVCLQVANQSEGQMRNAISTLEGVLSLVASGEAKISGDVVQRAYEESGDADLDKASIEMVASIINQDLIKALHAIRTSGNPRSLLHKSRFLISGLIGEVLKTNRWKALPLKTLLAKKLKLNLPSLIYAQDMLNQCELQMNSCSIPELVIIETEVGKLIAHDYFSKKK